MLVSGISEISGTYAQKGGKISSKVAKAVSAHTSRVKRIISAIKKVDERPTETSSSEAEYSVENKKQKLMARP